MKGFHDVTALPSLNHKTKNNATPIANNNAMPKPIQGFFIKKSPSWAIKMSRSSLKTRVL